VCASGRQNKLSEAARLKKSVSHLHVTVREADKAAESAEKKVRANLSFYFYTPAACPLSQ
jgi:hypothetical protein